MVDAQRVMGAKAGEPLLRARVPLERQPQRLLLGGELEHEVVLGDELDGERGTPAALQP
jgi:hypothetical protein